MSAPFLHVGVIGAGAWGTALAQAAATAGRDVTLWCRRSDLAVGISARQENAAYLPEIELDRRIRATHDFADMTSCDVFLSVVPVQHTRSVLTEFQSYAPSGAPVVMCSKGLEADTMQLMTQVLAETVPQARAAVLSGPSFAREVALGLPAAVTLACEEPALGRALATTLGRPEFRPYLTNDLIGAEVGGAVKNVLAIACGIVDGRRLGRNAHAAVVTRGFAELTRLGVALGARKETLQGLCGLGDLMLTCSSMESRNMSLGHALGQGRQLAQILADRKGVTEGVETAPALVALAEKRGVDMPISNAVYNVVAGRMPVEDAMDALLRRPFKVESA